MVLEKTLESPWKARSNQSILKEINPEYALEGLMLKLQYFGHLMRRSDSLQKTLMLGKTEEKRRGGWQRMRWLDSIIGSKDMNLSKLREMMKTREPGVLQSMASQKVGHDLATKQQTTACVPFAHAALASDFQTVFLRTPKSFPWLF